MTAPGGDGPTLLRALQARSGLSDAKVTELTGVKRSTVASYRSGGTLGRRGDTLSKALRIAEAYGATPEELRLIRQHYGGTLSVQEGVAEVGALYRRLPQDGRDLALAILRLLASHFRSKG